MLFLFAVDPNCGVNPTQFMESLYNSDGISCEPFECLGWDDFMYFKTSDRQIHGVNSIRCHGQVIFLQKVPKFTVIGPSNLDINSLIGLICYSHNILVKHSGETNPPTFYCSIKDAAFLFQSKNENFTCVPITENQEEEFYFSVSKSWNVTPEAIVSSLANQEGVDDAVRVSDSHVDDLPDWYFKSKCSQMKEIESVKIMRKAIAIVHLDTLPVPIKEEEFYFSVSKSWNVTPEAIISSLANQEEVDDAVRVSDSHVDDLPDWYFKSKCSQMKEIESVKITRKAIAIVHLDTLPSPPPPLPPPIPPLMVPVMPVPAPDPALPGARKFFIEIFHDAENCPCVGITPAGTFQNVIRRVLLALLNGDASAVDAIDITSSVRVKWNFVISQARWNNHNRPSDQFRSEMANVHGGTWVDPITLKSDAVNTKINELLSNYQQSFEALPVQAKANRVVLLISGDKDFTLSVRLLRQSDHQVMIIQNNNQISQGFLDLVPKAFQLGIWSDIADPMKPESSPFPVSPTKQSYNKLTSEDQKYIYDVAALVLSKGNKMPGAQICGLYHNAALKSALDRIGGLKQFSLMSEGILHSCSQQPPVFSVCIWSLVRLFVKGKGGRIPASQLSDLYSLLGQSGSILQKMIKDFGRIAKLCSSQTCVTSTCNHSSFGSLVFERVDDERVGYGYLVSDASSVNPMDATSPTNPNLAIVPLRPYQYYYARSYLQDILNQIVLEISANVVISFKSSSTPPRSELQLIYTPLVADNAPANGDDAKVPGDEEDPLVVLEECKNELLAIFEGTSNSKSTTGAARPGKIVASNPRMVSVSKETLLGDQNLKDLRENWLISWNVRPAGGDAADEDEDRKDLMMKIPKSWLNDAKELHSSLVAGGRGDKGFPAVVAKGNDINQFAKQGRGGGSGRGRGRGASLPREAKGSNANGFPNAKGSNAKGFRPHHPAGQRGMGVGSPVVRTVPDILTEMIQQHMSNYFKLDPSAYRIDLVLDRLINHAELVFRKDSDRNRILSSNLSVSSRTGATFHKSLSGENESEVIPSCSIVLYSQIGAESQVEEYWKEVMKLERMKVITDVFPTHTIPLPYRPLKEIYFFDDFSWKYFESEVETMSPSVILTLQQNKIGKTVIQLNGLKNEVEMASQYLSDRADCLLVKETRFSKNSSENLHLVLSKALKNLSKKYRKKMEKEIDDVGQDDGTSLQSVRTGFATTTYYIGKSRVTIVGTPEVRDLWQSQIDAAQELINYFTEQRNVPMNGVFVDLKAIKKDFALHECYHDKNTGCAVLSGLLDRVESAVACIELKLRGEVSKILSIGCNEPAYSWCLDRLVKYFYLPGPALLLAKLRDSLTEKFGREVTASISLNESGYNLLLVHCPDRLSEVVEREAREMVSVLVGGLISMTIPLGKGEVEWLKQSNVVDEHTLLEFLSPDFDADDDGDDSENDVLCECHFASISVSVLHIPRPPVALDEYLVLNEGRHYLSKTQLKGSLNQANADGEKYVALSGVGVSGDDSVEIAARETIVAMSEWVGSQPNPSIEKIVIFDHDLSMAHSLMKALEDLSEGNILPRTVSVPRDFQVPTHQWYRMLWEWEVSSHGALVRVLPFPDSEGRMHNYKVCPYDYDQVVQLETAYLHNRDSDLRLVGDVNGTKNQKSYIISFKDMTQTTEPIYNQYSTRRIFRVEMMPGEEKEIPLFAERLATHQQGVKDYEAEQRSRPILHPVLPSRPTPSNSRIASGVLLFGTDECVDITKNRLEKLLVDNKKSEVIHLELLSRYASIPFDKVYPELVCELAKLGAHVYPTQSDWEVSIECMGMLTLLESKNAALNFEKRLLANSLKTPYPESWGYGDIDWTDVEPTVVELDRGEDEYESAKACFLQKGFSATIRRIERIQNAELYEKYYKRRCEVARLNGGEVNELLMKHGTKTTPPATIWQSSPSKSNTYAFDFRYSSDRNFFGRGSYFTDDAGYVDGAPGLSGCYAHVLPNGDKQMFLALVAAGSSEELTATNRDIRTPSSGFQSVRGPITSAHHAIIVYELSQSYPMYLVTYSN